MTDREKFLNTARSYIGKNGQYVCLQKLKIGFVCDWCAFSVSSIMRDCGFIGKYIKEVEGGAGTIPRYSDGKYGDWFKKGTKAPQAGDLFFMRYADYPYQDKYFCDHVGIVESVNGNAITTLEGNVDGYSYNWASTSIFKRKTRYLSDGTVYAFYRPRWSGTSTTSSSTSQTKKKSVGDKEKFLQQAKTYIGQTGYGVCITKLKIGFVCDWCAFSVSSIMRDCGFIGKYIKAIEGGAGTIPRYSDGKYGDWFKKGTKAPQAGDLFFMRYADYPYQDKYFCDHVGIVESVNGNAITTLEGNVDGYSYNWASTSIFKRKTRYLSDGTVYAFYRPRWSGTSTTSSSTSQTKKKSVGELAKEVIAGKWSAGEERKQKLTDAGYDYSAVQNRVNELLSGKTPQKSVDELAREVIQGKWGAGDERKKFLAEAGYNYDEVQKKVNEIMSKM